MAQNFSKMPSIYPLYLQALWRMLKRGKAEKKLSPLEITSTAVVTNQAHLTKYNKLCGFGESNHLPVTYPHLLAFPLQMKLLTDKSFPYPLLGLVHIRNNIKQYQAITKEQVLTIHCHINMQRQVDKGIEFDIETIIECEHNLVWQSTSTMLYRLGSGQKTSKGKPSSKETDKDTDHQQKFIIAAENIGRKYAKVSGDINPIHLFKWSAKLFGFPAPIAHGMWSIARSIATFQPQLTQLPFSFDVQFKQPILLPAELSLKHQSTAKGTKLTLVDKAESKLHFIGQITSLK